MIGARSLEGISARLLLAALLALSSLTGCINCFDDGELEAAHREGEALAKDANAAAYDRGHSEAGTLSFADGVADGDYDGYEDGYFDGYYGPVGYPNGYDRGYIDGHGVGLFDPAACTGGANDGYVAGENAGYYAGWDDGYGQAWDDGYGAGYNDGASACDYHATKVDPDEAEVCVQRGYDRNLDRTSHERGYQAGKLDNPEYQAGYASQYELAYFKGLGHGELDGYDDGQFDGFNDGFVTGYDVAYFECYDQAYPDGFDAGHGAGWTEGLNLGYSEGYQAGYEDAASEC